MLSISLYYISIVTEFTTYYTWYYIYTGCYTLSISKTSISPRGRSERGLTRKAQESKITRREKIERRQISSKTMEAWTASNMPTGADISYRYPFLFTSKYWLILEFFLSRSLISTRNKNLYWEKLLSGRELRVMPTEGTLWILIRKGILEERISVTRGPGPAKFIASSLQTRTNHESSRLTDDKMPVLLRGRPAGRRLINDDKRDENGFDLSDEWERD